MKPLKLLLVDLDDTLIDNTDADVESFRYVLTKFGIMSPTRQQIIQWRKNGMFAKNMFKKIIKKDSHLLQKCVKLRLEFLKNGKNLKYLKPKNDSYSSLEKIKSKYTDIIIVVVTSRMYKKDVYKILKQCKLNKFVNGVFCADDVEMNGVQDYAKLKEKLYTLAMIKFNQKKTETMAIGNLKTDIIAGKNLKIKTRGIKGSYRIDSGMKNLTETFESLTAIISQLT